jgi:hypothetical protein
MSPIAFGDERQPSRRLAAFAQPLGGFLEARGAPDAIEQVLARVDIEGHLLTDRHHSPLLSPATAGFLFEQD